jgi:hypothetical protein
VAPGSAIGVAVKLRVDATAGAADAEGEGAAAAIGGTEAEGAEGGGALVAAVSLQATSGRRSSSGVNRTALLIMKPGSALAALSSA